MSTQSALIMWLGILVIGLGLVMVHPAWTAIWIGFWLMLAGWGGTLKEREKSKGDREVS